VAAADDVGRVCKLDVGRSVPQAVDAELGKGEKVGLRSRGASLGMHGEDSMSDLLDDDGAGYLGRR